MSNLDADDNLSDMEWNAVAIRKIRNAAIEECARVVEFYYPSIDKRTSIAAAIRALKDKP